MKIPFYQLDSFTKEKFSGNPAGVCVLNEWIDASIMQNIATENNLAETGFIVKKENIYELRWFTPLVEVDLCGHVTLASGYVLSKYYNEKNNPVQFFSPRSGNLNVFKEESGALTLDFPTDELKKCEIPDELQQGFNIEAQECYKGKTDYVLIFNSQDEIEKITPDLSMIKKADARGVIITAPGNKVDFVSRFFAPQSGIDEDPVTGSAHTSLTPYWSQRLNKKELSAMQLSKRKGHLRCTNNGDRILISGHVVVYLEGEIAM